MNDVPAKVELLNEALIFLNHFSGLCFCLFRNKSEWHSCCFVISVLRPEPAQQVSKNATISRFHPGPPSSPHSGVCMATAHSVLLFPLIFVPCSWSRDAGVKAISDSHWKWQVNFVQLLPFSVPLSRHAPVPDSPLGTTW